MSAGQFYDNISNLLVISYDALSDSEGDFIAFSSDEELVTALSEIENGVFKMSIKGMNYDRSLRY